MTGEGHSDQHGHAEQWAETSHCRVIGARRYGTFAALELAAPKVARKASPGQFVMVSVPGGGFFLRRPLSLFSVRGDRVGILVEERGAGSRRLTEFQVGDTVQLAGPLGTSFPIVGVRHAVLAGGGIGCAPLQYLGDELTAAGAEVVSAFGFRDLAAARVAAAFTASEMVVATEDGSVGRPGTVMNILASLDLRPETVVYACGPKGMVAAVQAWCQARELRGYASLEAHMACGSGSCHGCVVETARGQMRVCSEGPVFPLAEVML